MYVVLTKNTIDPIVKSKNDLDYPDYIFSGYIESYTGSKDKCEKYVDELLELSY